jgi:hypothetical protein
MPSFAFADRLWLLPGVSLAELDARAALLSRRDRKYLVPMAVAERVLTELADQVRVLDIEGRRQFRYESVYFDTPEHMSYLTSARRRPHRFKVRTRAYLDTGRCVLEVKTRDGRGRTVKTQHDKALERRDRLDPGDRAVVGSYPEIGVAGRSLEQAVTTRYSRATLLVGQAAARATFDTDVTAVAPDGRSVQLAGMAIVESKSAGAPSPVDRWLWASGHRPIRVSKFGTGLAALFPELPSNKWHRALNATWQPGSMVAGRT